MLEKKIISIEELSKFGSTKSLNDMAVSLVEQQKANWETAAKNFRAINHIRTKSFDFGHFQIHIQHNPERIRSSAAKTDAKSIAARPCFLCLENLPPEQRGIIFQDKYLILTNPYPIFPKHLTISKLEHTPQEILLHLDDMLNLSQSLPDFTVFYNGPRCGASAPDHFHFQAGNNEFLPVSKEFEILEKEHSKILFQNRNLKIISVENYLRRFVAIISSDKNQMLEKFELIYQYLSVYSEEEPMMNVLCNYENNRYRLIIFPRNVQHPSHFHKKGDERIVVGPASVELGGMLVLPREEDINKITKKEIAEIYDEVSITNKNFEILINRIKTK